MKKLSIVENLISQINLPGRGGPPGLLVTENVDEECNYGLECVLEIEMELKVTLVRGKIPNPSSAATLKFRLLEILKLGCLTL